MKNQKGQILLITIMLVATVLTVVLAVTFKSTTETQLTKLEEQSQKALTAAEAGIEVALQQELGSSVSIGSLPEFTGSGFSGQASVEALTDSKFVSPLLLKDQQYTFYLAEYPGFANPLNGYLALYLQSEADCPALELTFLSPTNTVKRLLVDPCDKISKPDFSDLSTTTNPGGGTYSLAGYSFGYKTQYILLGISHPLGNQAVLIARSLFASTRVGLERIDPGNLPIQGKYVTSEAKTPSGVSRKVQLFQSYPQIPAEFFVISF